MVFACVKEMPLLPIPRYPRLHPRFDWKALPFHACLFSGRWCFFYRKMVCECGYPREQHLEDAIKASILLGKEWDPRNHVQEMPTDAFGEISFTGLGQKVGKVGVPSDV